MRDVQALKALAIQAITDALNYLTNRAPAESAAGESEPVQAWIQTLQDSQAVVVASNPAEFGDEEQDRSVVLELGAIRARIRQHHETDDFASVSQTLSDLQTTIQYFAGSGGTGAGNPAGWPGRGKPRSG